MLDVTHLPVIARGHPTDIQVACTGNAGRSTHSTGHPVSCSVPMAMRRHIRIRMTLVVLRRMTLGRGSTPSLGVYT